MENGQRNSSLHFGDLPVSVENLTFCFSKIKDDQKVHQKAITKAILCYITLYRTTLYYFNNYAML